MSEQRVVMVPPLAVVAPRGAIWAADAAAWIAGVVAGAARHFRREPRKDQAVILSTCEHTLSAAAGTADCAGTTAAAACHDAC